MNPIAALTKRVAANEAAIANLQQDGIVTAVHESENLVDVEVRGIPLEKVPYLTWRAGGDGKSYWVPEVGESGIVFCAGGQAGNARFLPGLNTTRNPAPESDPDVVILDFGDGRKITIDNTESKLERNIGKIILEVGTTELEVTATQIKGTIAGLGKILVNATLVNVNGATFTAVGGAGTTNLLGAVPITYVPIPIT